jgi:hypothetical protein
MAFKAELPLGVSLPEGHRIDVSDARFKAFSSVLGIEAGRVSAAHASARAPTPAPVAPAPDPKKIEGWDKMSSREQFAASLATPSRRG